MIPNVKLAVRPKNIEIPLELGLWVRYTIVGRKSMAFRSEIRITFKSQSFLRPTLSIWKFPWNSSATFWLPVILLADTHANALDRMTFFLNQCDGTKTAVGLRFVSWSILPVYRFRSFDQWKIEFQRVFKLAVLEYSLLYDLYCFAPLRFPWLIYLHTHSIQTWRDNSCDRPDGHAWLRKC